MPIFYDTALYFTNQYGILIMGYTSGFNKVGQEFVPL